MKKQVINFRKTGIKPFVCTAIFSVLFSVSFGQSFSGGDGSQGNPYKISTPEDLVELSDMTNVNGGAATVGKYFVMTNSIDMVNISDFRPIGIMEQDWSQHFFSGNFDGKGFSIKNLTIIDTVNNSWQISALFGFVKGAKISNLIMDNASFSSMTSVASLVGDTYDSLYMENCVALNCTLKGSKISGFIQMLSGTSRINNCHVINAKTEGRSTSGFCNMVADATAQITNSSVRYSTLTSGGKSISTMEGFGGINSSKVSNCIVSNCILSAGNVGGFTYMVGQGEMDNCGVVASLSKTKDDGYLSGFAWWTGAVGATTTFSNCYSACEFISDSVESAFGGNAAQGTAIVTNCYYKTDPRVIGGNSSLVGKSEADLKAAGIVAFPGSANNSLNYNQSSAAWKQDFAVNPINKGYPILGWQTHCSYISTYHATDITKETAVLNGLTFAEGEGIITERGFQWRVKGTGSWTTVTLTDTTFNISHLLTGLTKNTTYEYFAYMKTPATMYGDTVEFTTMLAASSVITLAATDIAETTAKINGSVNEDQEDPVTERGFEWRKVGAGSWTTVSATGTTAISASLTGLTKSTAYEFRAYIRTSLATRYGVILKFTTSGGAGIVETHNDASVRVYPNPTYSQLRIENYKVEMGEIAIYDVVGRKIVNCSLLIDNWIDISHLANGLYFLKIGNKTVKIIKN